jgi:hypothetical protein
MGRRRVARFAGVSRRQCLGALSNACEGHSKIRPCNETCSLTAFPAISLHSIPRVIRYVTGTSSSPGSAHCLQSRLSNPPRLPVGTNTSRIRDASQHQHAGTPRVSRGVHHIQVPDRNRNFTHLPFPNVHRFLFGYELLNHVCLLQVRVGLADGGCFPGKRAI